MSDFLTRFEDQLRAASPPRRRVDLPRAALVAALALALSGTALAASGVWSPIVGDSRRGHPSTTGDAPPQIQLDRLAVLRRAPTSADRGWLVRKALSYFGPDVAGVRTDYARLLHDGDFSAVLVPVERFNVGLVDKIGPDAPQQRRQVLREQPDGLCVFAPDPSGDGGGQTCVTTTQLDRGYIPGSDGPTIYGIVPDRVARVVLELDGGTRLAATPNANLFAVSMQDTSSPGHAAPAVREVSWLDDHGNQVARVVRRATSIG